MFHVGEKVVYPMPVSYTHLGTGELAQQAQQVRAQGGVA